MLVRMAIIKNQQEIVGLPGLPGLAGGPDLGFGFCEVVGFPTHIR